MGYRFMGEGIPELNEFPAEKRRSVYLRAVKKSYTHGGTWFGLVLCTLLLYAGTKYTPEINQWTRQFFASPKRSEMFLSIAIALAGLFCLYTFQMRAVKSELLKMMRVDPQS